LDPDTPPRIESQLDCGLDPPDWRKPDQTPPGIFWPNFFQFSMAERLEGPIASFGPRPQVNFLDKPGGSGPLLNRGGLLDGRTTWELRFGPPGLQSDGRLTRDLIDFDGRMTWDWGFQLILMAE